MTTALYTMKIVNAHFTIPNHVAQRNYPNTHCSSGHHVRAGNAKRQTQMKHLIYITLLAIACNGGLTSTHEVRYSPDGNDSVVVMKYYDGHQYNNIYMGYELFKDLYDEGGYESVYDYYLAHELPEYWLKKYATYK